MKYMFFIFLLLLSTSCKKNNIEVFLLNNEVGTKDSLKIKIQNNTNENYLFYFNNNRLEFTDNPNSLEIMIESNAKPVKSDFTIIDAFIIPDEETGINKMDSLEMAKYFDCSESLIKIIPSKSYVILKFLLIDHANRCGSAYFPVIEKDKSYKLTLKMNMDSNLIEKKEFEKIKMKYKNNAKFFQGKLVSNTVDLE